jgi:hypothetical protein
MCHTNRGTAVMGGRLVTTTEIAEGLPTADEIFNRSPPTKKPKLSDMLVIGIELLPTIEDGLTADVVEQLLLALVEREEALFAISAIVSAAMHHSHTLHVENARLQRVLTGLRDENRKKVAK